jgi:hypothetical protein
MALIIWTNCFFFSRGNTFKLKHVTMNITGQANEVPMFTCVATSGALAFYFGGTPTGNFPHDSSVAEVKAALEHHPSVVEVVVTFNSSGSAAVCQLASNVVTVKFTQN